VKFKIGDKSDLIEEATGTATLYHENQVKLDDITKDGKPVVILVDADIVAYRCSATADGRKYKVSVGGTTEEFSYKKNALEYCEKYDIDKEHIKIEYVPEPVNNARSNVDQLMKKMSKELRASKVECYLTPDVIFRADYMSDYKANRIGVRKPTHLKACKKHLTEKYGAEQVDGYEADDLLAIRARQILEEGESIPIICSTDKDLDMISCYHYNWTKKSLYFVTPEEGTINFYTQLLVGDATDNIPGIYGVGPKTAKKILEECDGSSSFECYIRVLNAYIEADQKKDDSETKEVALARIVAEVTRNARLLHILHHMGEVWYPPVAKREEEEINGS